MFKLDRRKFWVIGLCIAILSFILLSAGMRIYSGMQISFQNDIAYGIFSLILGAVAALLVYFRLKISLFSYVAGIIIGYFLMFRAFLYDNSGWGDLVGVISMLMWVAIGLGVGLLLQLVKFLYKKFKK